MDRGKGVNSCGVDRAARIRQTADWACIASIALLFARIPLLRRSGGCATANLSKARLGSSDGRGPARSDRSKNLHHQCDQKDRQAFRQTPPHRGRSNLRSS